MNEDQTISNLEMQKRKEHLQLQTENTQYSQSQGLGMNNYAQTVPQATQSLTVCPVCGSALPEGADYCENCRKYVKHDVCSFCGAAFEGDGAYCPECGSPRGGVPNVIRSMSLLSVRNADSRSLPRQKSRWSICIILQNIRNSRNSQMRWQGWVMWNHSIANPTRNAARPTRLSG